MEIRFGRPVVSVDGERVGMVDRFLLDPESRYVREIRILHGSDERSFPFQSVTNVNADGIIDIGQTAFEVRQSSLDRGISSATLNRANLPSTTWVSTETLIESAPPGVPGGPPYSLSEREEWRPERVELDSGIFIAGPGGKVVGTIAGIVVQESGQIDELIIDTGFLRPDIRVSMDSVEYVEGSYVSHML